jgi:hypothetical protein
MRNEARNSVRSGQQYNANYGNSQSAGCSGSACGAQISRTAEAFAGARGSYRNGNFAAQGSVGVTARATGQSQANADLRNGRLSASAQGEVFAGAEARGSASYNKNIGGINVGADASGSAQVGVGARGQVGAQMDLRKGTFNVGASGDAFLGARVQGTAGVKVGGVGARATGGVGAGICFVLFCFFL